MKYIIILTTLLYSNHNHAQVIWPSDSAPCNGTLTECADAIPRGEVIEIHTNGPIDQSLNTVNGVSVIAGAGFKPVFSDGRGIDMSGTSHGDLTITISGLTLSRGRISYNARTFTQGLNTQLNITNNVILSSSNPNYAISISNFGSHILDLNLDSNNINYTQTATGSEFNGAITIKNGVNFGASAIGEISGKIINNEFISTGTESKNIGFYEESDSSSNVIVSSNKFTGGETAAMYYFKSGDSTGISRLDFAHNVTYSNEIDDNYRGLMTEVLSGELDVYAINNTITNAFDGFNFQESGSGELNVELYNNIVANSGSPVILNFYNLIDSTIDINNNNNLFFNNELIDPDFAPGSAFSNADPMFKSPTNSRLKANSPAIESGNGLILFAIASVPLVDADGLHRIKKGDDSVGAPNVDLGAYETGDIRTLDRFNSTNTHVNNIDSVAINSRTKPNIQVTHNWNPLTSTGIYNNANFGIFKPASSWSIFNQDFVDMNPGSAFNIWSPGDSINNFVHKASDAAGTSESSTLITANGLMNNPDAILAITQIWDLADGGVYNDNPIGAFYDTFQNQWRIYNSNLVDMPLDAQFNVYYQTASSSAYVHQVVPENTFGNISYLEHPKLNGNPCAQIQITHVGLTINPYPTGVYYDLISSQWAIFNQGGDAMANNAKFHVILSPEQIIECDDVIFADSFD